MYRAYEDVISKCLVSIEDVPCVYKVTLGATTETRRQNTAAQAVVHHGRSASGFDEFGGSTEIRGDSINSGHI